MKVRIENLDDACGLRVRVISNPDPGEARIRDTTEDSIVVAPGQSANVEFDATGLGNWRWLTIEKILTG